MPPAAMNVMRETVARLLPAAVDAYTAWSPVKRGRPFLRGWSAGALLRLECFVPRRVVVRQAGVELPLWLNLGSITGARAWGPGLPEVSGVAECVEAMTRRPGVFLDLGANAGLFSFVVADRCPRTRVIAVEPHPRLATLLRRDAEELGARLARHGSRVEVVETALGASDGTVVFHQLCHDDISSLYPVPGHAGRAVVTPLRRGDALLAALDVGTVELCKLDVEGAELAVLRGLEETLKHQRIRRLRMEINRERCAAAGHAPDDLVAALARHGYGLTPDSAAAYARGGWAWADFDFIPAGAAG